MRKFKTADCIIQGTLITSAVILNTVNHWNTLDDPFILYYFVVGGWQLLSVIVHLFIPAVYKIFLRKVCLVLLLLTIIAGIISSIYHELFGFALLLLLWSPVLALLYFIVCVTESRRLKIADTNKPAVA